MAAWEDLNEVMWRAVTRNLHMEDIVRLSASCFGLMELNGGFEALTETAQDYWRMIDQITSSQEALAHQDAVWELLDEYEQIMEGDE